MTAYKKALYLGLFTVFYNIIEGLFSIYFGFEDETLTLLGFGIDSFIEVISGLGIVYMILRIQKNAEAPESKFEITALKITGTAFYLLSAGLLAGIINNIATGHKPENTFWGIVVSVVSIIVMTWLAYSKRKVGIQLHSEPIIADSKCTLVCIYMSIVLLIASLIYETTGFAYADVLGSAGLIWFSVKEGKESFEKAKGIKCNCCE